MKQTTWQNHGIYDWLDLEFGRTRQWLRIQFGWGTPLKSSNLEDQEVNGRKTLRSILRRYNWERNVDRIGQVSCSMMNLSCVEVSEIYFKPIYLYNLYTAPYIRLSHVVSVVWKINNGLSTTSLFKSFSLTFRDFSAYQWNVLRLSLLVACRFRIGHCALTILLRVCSITEIYSKIILPPIYISSFLVKSGLIRDGVFGKVIESSSESSHMESDHVMWRLAMPVHRNFQGFSNSKGNQFLFKRF
jgi:hypothetical protein